MPEPRQDPILNPLLTLTSTPRRQGIVGRGKDHRAIKSSRLRRQRQSLAEDLESLNSDISKAVSGNLAVVVEMYEDSLAPSYAPNDLFASITGSKLLTPFKDGYLAQLNTGMFSNFKHVLRTSDNIRCLVDISRVKKIHALGKSDVFGTKTPDSIFQKATKFSINGAELREFIVWFVPFKDSEIRASAIRSVASAMRINGLAESEGMTQLVPLTDHRAAIQLPSGIFEFDLEAIVRSVALNSIQQVSALAASGKVIRIDPVTEITPAEVRINDADTQETFVVGAQPIVGVIDGGRSAQSYAYAEAWAAPPLVDTSIADNAHGNGVTSLIVEGHKLNPSLQLPQLSCRVGTTQVLTQKRFRSRAPNIKTLIPYLDNVMLRNPTTKIWNISANTDYECGEFGVSLLGHAITILARKHKILPIISAGNKLPNENLRIAPPGDCEAGLIIAGRLSNSDGSVAGACSRSRVGLGPEDMLKPDLSWFSTVKVLGAQTVTGTSFSAPLVSRLAAQSWEKLRTPTPDLVKALLLNSGDLDQFDRHLGWGSPIHPSSPWECETGSVTIAWNSSLRPNLEHYWDDIAIPRSMLDGYFLRGRISLTAVLNPILLNSVGVGNYFMTRIEVSLQDTGISEDDSNSNVLGSMQDKLSEIDARRIDHKWSPIRRHSGKFRRKKLHSNKLRLRARIYTRDLWQLEISANDLSEFDVAFVLKFESPDKDPNTYSSFVRAMRQHVESAVIDQNIEIRN